MTQPLPRLLANLATYLLVGCGGSSAPATAPHEQLGKPVSFTLVSNDGEPLELPPAGHKAVLDYWAPSCVPCKTKLPALISHRTELQNNGARLVLVAILAEDESTARAEHTLAEWGAPGERFLIDRNDISARTAGVVHLPTTQIYDSHQVLRWVAPTSANATDVVSATREVN